MDTSLGMDGFFTPRQSIASEIGPANIKEYRTAVHGSFLIYMMKHKANEMTQVTSVTTANVSPRQLGI